MATLAEFTAARRPTRCCATRRRPASGGLRRGRAQRHLMQRLAARSGRGVQSSQALGVPPEQVEALAFAWLARAFGRHEPGNRRLSPRQPAGRAVTGA
jgi:anhydro-N-acetylmuramic acid kinase